MLSNPHHENWMFIRTIGRNNGKKVDVFFDKKNNALITIRQGWSLSGRKEPTDAKD